MQKLLAKDRKKTCTFIFGWSANQMLYENGHGMSCKPIHFKGSSKRHYKNKNLVHITLTIVKLERPMLDGKGWSCSLI